MWQPVPERRDLPATSRAPSDLVLAFRRVFHVNGESTDDTLVAADRLADHLGLRASILPRWGELQIESADDGLVSVAAADPTGIDMDRVASAVRAIDEFTAGRLRPAAATETIQAIARAPPAPTWLFTLAAAAGAAALSVIFGVQHAPAIALIVASAAAGAVLRRTLARYSTNPLLQPLGAALLAGVIGALAVRNQLSSPLRLVAICPCMILVPGPHVLNGMIDLAALRIHLGASRLGYAGLVIVPVARRRHMPFAAIGFASVVSMIPGVYLFRMASGLQQLASGSSTAVQHLGATVAAGATALDIILAMSFGLIIPKIAIDRLVKP